MARPTDSNEQLLCSFCGKSQRQVKKLIAGPGVYICDECIDLCNEIIDEELLDSLRAATQGPGRPPTSEKKLQKSLERAKQEGRDEPLREDIAMRKAVDLMVDSATAISVDQAKARDKLWTPEKDEKEAGAQEIWTPGS